MFVQTGHFIEDVRHAVVNDAVTFHGQEKSDTNTKLARMNLVVHGLDASNIGQGNTFMMAIGNKFFYTRSLPCTLWFFDRGKPHDLLNQVLMIDARHVYHVVSARSHVFTDEQLANLNAIVWLYRGEREKFITLVDRYHRQVDEWLAAIPGRIAADTAAVAALAEKLSAFAEGATLAELNAGQPDTARLAPPAFDDFKAELAAHHAALRARDGLGERALLQAVTDARQAIAAAEPDSHGGQRALQATLDALAPQLKSASKTLETRHKQWLKLLDTAEKSLRARQSRAFDAKAVRDARRALLAADPKKNEDPTVRDAVLDALKQAAYFIHQGHWLHSRFPHALYEDVSGLCKAVSIEEIAANDWSLTPGRYVGVPPADAGDEDDFAETLREIHDELGELNDKAVELAGRIAANLEALLG
jgi:type I restriction enzyme M protein